MIVRDIDACLPQTQCQRCTYPGCEDYAQAIITGEAGINQCPPGGDITISKLAALTGQAPLPLNLEFGEYQPKTLAFIDEPRCIGCVLCVQVCPVDAIVGANKLMHTVIQSHCTGCELCLPVCPTDCIKMHALPDSQGATSEWPGYSTEDIEYSRQRYQQRQTRLAKLNTEKTAQKPELDTASRQQAILDAVRRSQQKK